MEDVRQRLRRLFTATGLACLVAGASVFAPLDVPRPHAPRDPHAGYTATRSVWTAQMPARPIAVLVDEGTHRVFVLTQDYRDSYVNPTGVSSLSTFDAATGALVRTTRGGVGAVQAVLDMTAGRLYVLSQEPFESGTTGPVRPGSVSVFDATTGALVRTTRVGINAVALAVDEQRGHVFALTADPQASDDPSSGATSVLDAATGMLTRTLPHAGGTALAVSARTSRLFAASSLSCPPTPSATDRENPGCLGVFDVVTGRRLATRPLSQTVGLRAMAADDVDGHILAFQESARSTLDDQSTNHIVVRDDRTGSLVHSAPLNDAGGGLGAFATSVTAGRAVVVTVPDGYQIQEGGGTVDVSTVDLRSGRPLRTELANGGKAARYGFHACVVIDARRGRVIVLTQQLADALGHPQGPAALTVLDARTGRLLHTTPGQVGDVALGLDAARGHLFVANARSNTVRMLAVARL